MTASDSRGLGRCTGIGQHVLPCTGVGSGSGSQIFNKNT